MCAKLDIVTIRLKRNVILAVELVVLFVKREMVMCHVCLVMMAPISICVKVCLFIGSARIDKCIQFTVIFYSVHYFQLHFFTACDDSLCLACNEADDICTECVPGAYLTSTDDCSPCAFGCLLCSDGTTCSDCLDGSYWDTEALSCKRQ